MLETSSYRSSHPTYLVIFVERHDTIHLPTDKHTGLESPGTRNVAHGVATASKDQCRKAKTLDVAHAVSVAIHAEVEAAKPIAGQAVSSTLQDYSLWLVVLHDIFDNRLEDGLV